jgi:hypothetical protein
MPVFIAREGKARQLSPDPFRNEKELQHFFEHNLDSLLGIRFVASEFGTGQKHAGRIDTLGLDEAGNPVIIEYKWDKSESVINQGLLYLDWLMDHRGDFTVAAQKVIGQDVLISWSGPRLVIVAASYTKYDRPGPRSWPSIWRLPPSSRYAQRWRRSRPDVSSRRVTRRLSSLTWRPPPSKLKCYAATAQAAVGIRERSRRARSRSASRLVRGRSLRRLVDPTRLRRTQKSGSGSARSMASVKDQPGQRTRA